MLNSLSGAGHGTQAYAPIRDIVQLFPQVIGVHAVQLLAVHRMPPALQKFAGSAEITPQELAEAERAFAAYVRLSVHFNSDDLPTLWVNSGMVRLRPPVLLALLAAIGEVTMKIFYKTARSSIRQGQNVCGIDALESTVDRVVDSMSADLPSEQHRRTLAAEGAALPDLINNTPQ